MQIATDLAIGKVLLCTYSLTLSILLLRVYVALVAWWSMWSKWRCKEQLRKVPLKKPVEVFTQESKPYLSIENVLSLLYRNGTTMSSYRLFPSCYCTASTAAAGTYFISSKFISQVAFDVAVKHDVMACTKVGLHQPPPFANKVFKHCTVSYTLRTVSSVRWWS